MGRRSRNRKTVETVDYRDDEGNVLTLRRTDANVPRAHRSAASSVDDHWHREGEILFERYVVRWEIYGLPLVKQKELLARYRMAGSATQDWIRRTIERHIEAA